MPRRLAQQLAAGTAARIGFPDVCEPAQIELRIAHILIFDQPPDAFEHDFTRGIRKLGGRLRQHGIRRTGRAVLLVGSRPRRNAPAHRRETRAEAAQICLDRLAVLADRGLEQLRRYRQDPRAGDRAEHDRIDHRAALRRQSLHVEQPALLGLALDRMHQMRAVEAPVAHRHLLLHHEETMGRGDDEGAIRGDKAGADGAARLQELAGEQQVDVADAGMQREHRPPAAELGGRDRQDLDVIGGGAGALRDAGNRRALRRQPVPRRRGNHPAGEHAAALAAERGNEQMDRPRAHPPASAMRPPSQPMTRLRQANSRRSKKFGLRMISTR